MKTDLKKLVEASEELCVMLETLRNSEENCYAELIMHLERYNMQANCMKNNLKEIEMELENVI